MNCTKCQLPDKIKAGFVGERQRYKCKDCSCFLVLRRNRM
ncbi:IS1/IS1595 family N-terminal zinc-binding domain-containing protein [Bergeyella cardium]